MSRLLTSRSFIGLIESRNDCQALTDESPSLMPPACGCRLARLWLRPPHEHGAGAVDAVDGDHVVDGFAAFVVDTNGRGALVGGDQHAFEAALLGFDVGEPDVDGLADLALEVGGRPQAGAPRPGSVTSSV